MRFVPGACGTGTPRFAQVRPPSVLAQHSAAPSHSPWHGSGQISVTMSPVGSSVRLGQPQA